MKKLGSFLQSRTFQLLIVILITLFSYLNILQNGFAWDDRDFFIDWPQIKSTKDLPAYLSLPDLLKGDLPLSHRGIYRPVRSVYYLASYSIWGENPVGYHIQAIIVHTLIVLVVYLITELITKKRLLSSIVSLLFATHPIHTEAVTSITASMDTLGILFFFLSFYCYLKWGQETVRKNIFYLASIIYAFLAFFTYEVTLILPFLIILYDLCSNNFLIKKIIPKISIYKNYFLIILVYLLVRFIILGVGSRADFFGDSYAIIANQARVGFPEIIKDYLSWLIWPVNLTISHTAPTNLLSGFLQLLNTLDHSGKLISLFAQLVFIFPLIYTLVLIVVCYLFFKKFPLIFFGFIWFVLALLPVSSIIPQGAISAERFLYLPSFGFSFLSGLLFYYLLTISTKKRLLKRLPYLVSILLSCLVLFYIYQTIKRNIDWRNEKTIWQSAIKVEPESYRPYAALASIYVREQQYNEAGILLKKSIELNPDYTSAIYSLGFVYEKTGHPTKAITQYQKLVKLVPENYMYHIYLGNIYLSQKEYNQAEEEYKIALAIKKDHPVILSYIGNVYYNQKNYDQALDFYQQALALDPTSDILYTQIGLVNLKKQKYDLAVTSFSKSLELNPKQPDVYIELAYIYKQWGNIQKALELLNEGLNETNNLKIKGALKTIRF